MKLSQAKELLHLIQAAATGKTIQYKAAPGYASPREWTDYPADDGSFGRLDTFIYRIKPSPRLRPWKPEEVPVGAQIKNKVDGCFRSVILGINDSKEIIMLNNNATHYVGVLGESLQSCLIYRLHSTDGGVSWKPCGVEECE